MKNLKRLIALVAVFALALTTIASAATFTDVAEDSAYYEAVETLTKLGIIDGMPDGTYQPEKVVTRAEMAKLIATMQGLGNTAQSGSATKFSDVPASHWASGYIANATGVAINGYPNGTFGPENNVKFEEAVKMIMATLGYTVVANGNGGYPMGYVTAAIKEGVTDNVANANVGTDANRGTIAQLIYNAIDTPLVEQITWEADGSGEYTKYDGTGNKAYKTLMSENLDVVKMNGVVLANNYMSVNEYVSYDAEEDATVEITVDYGYKVAGNDFFDKDGDSNYPNGYTFLAADSDAADYVGKAVIYFAMENDYDEWEIISISENPTYNKSVTFALADFDAAKSTDGAIYYFKDGASKSTKLNIQSNVKGLYNNAYFDMVTVTVDDQEDEDPENDIITRTVNYNTLIGDLKAGFYGGQVTLIDTDKTTGYDTIIVEAAASAVVDSIEDGVIVLKSGAVFDDGEEVAEIDTEDDNLVVVLTKDGEEVTVDAVAEGDVVSILWAENGACLVADVMSNIVEGAISARKDSDTSANTYAYKIDGTWYDVAAGATIAGTVKAGDTGVFYIDKYGKIAYYDKSKSTSGNFAYVMEQLLDTDDWGAKTYEIKLLTKDGVKTYKVADTFKYNGTSETVKSLGAEKDIEGKLIDVTFSGEYIKAITVEGFDSELLDDGASVSGTFVAEDYEIDGTPDISIEKDAMVFFVEIDFGEDGTAGGTGADADSFKSSECYVGTLADLSDSDDVAGKYYFNDDSTEDASILVLVNATSSVNAASNIAVITDVEDASNEDEEDIYALTALYNGAEVTLTTTADVYDANSGLEIGDVVKVKVNANNVVTAMELVTDDIAVDRSAGAVVSATIEYTPGANETVVADYASAIKKDSKKLTVGGTEYALSKFANIYVVDYTGRDLEVKKGSSASFKFEERFFPLAGDKHIFINDGATDIGTDTDKVADYVIIRAYEGSSDVFEAVIVKGADYKIKTVD